MYFSVQMYRKIYIAIIGNYNRFLHLVTAFSQSQRSSVTLVQWLYLLTLTAEMCNMNDQGDGTP